MFIYRLDADTLEIYYRQDILNSILDKIVKLIETENSESFVSTETAESVLTKGYINEAKNINSYIRFNHDYPSIGITKKCISVKVQKVDIPLPIITDFKQRASK